MLNSKELLKETSEFKQPKKIPIDLGGSPATSIAAVAYAKLLKYLCINDETPHLYDFMQQLSYPKEKIRNLFNVNILDINQLFMNSESDWREFVIPFNGTRCLIPKYWDELFDIEKDKNETVFLKHKDGTILGKMPKTSTVVDQTFWPFADFKKIPEKIDADLLEKHLWNVPQPLTIIKKFQGKNNNYIINKLKTFYKTSNYALMFPFGGNLFDIGFAIRRMDSFLIDLFNDRKGVERLINHILENHMRSLEEILRIYGQYIDVILFYDDLSYQTGLFLPPDLYRKMIKPLHKRMWDYIHDYSNCKVCFHCCGAIYELIPDLIEAGIDFLNPVQISASGMEPKKLKKEFGKYISFWGGSCDPRTLTTKTPKEVKEEVKRNVEIFSRNGGYVFSSIHNITSEVNPENVVAMFEAVNEF